jgi:hypothetical protein
MTPKIKIEGPLTAGSAVYLMEGGKAFTTDKAKASKAYPQPMGQIIKSTAGGVTPPLSLKFNAFAEGALSSLE